MSKYYGFKIYDTETKEILHNGLATMEMISIIFTNYRLRYKEVELEILDKTIGGTYEI